MNLTDNITDYILNLDEPQSCLESVEQFKVLYQMESLKQWYTTDIAFDICNFILRHRPDLISLAIRVNVQVNLFLRSINKYATDPNKIFDKIGYKIGCFALTEEEAGVLSGLIVDTTFKEESDKIILNSGLSSKNWISQGMSADYAVVYASSVEDKNKVRMFLVDMNDASIQREKINSLHISRSLDLAKITFNETHINNDNMLSKSSLYSKINLLDGIFFGRYMIAEATVSALLGFINHIKRNICKEQKIRTRFEKLGFLTYLYQCEASYDTYRKHLTDSRNDTVFVKQDIFLINCYKIYVVEQSIHIFNKLSMMFGMRAATWKLNFSNLLLHKVAEGDTYVLRLSLLNNLQKSGISGVLTQPGFTWGDLFMIKFLLKSKKDIEKYIMNNFKEISDRVIFNNIPLLIS